MGRIRQKKLRKKKLAEKNSLEKNVVKTRQKNLVGKNSS